MKSSFYKIMCITFLIAGGCTSGQESPTDSHPGSGSIKKDSKPDNEKMADTTKKDGNQKDSSQKSQNTY